MSEDYEKLKHIGVQKIHEDTHISRSHIIAVLESEFKNLNKVQFLGFISILEREYSLDLSVLRNEGLEYFSEQESALKSEQGVFIVAKSQKKSSLPYVLIALFIILGVAFFGLDFNSKNNVVEVQNVENEIIKDVKKNIIENNISDANLSDINSSVKETNASSLALDTEKVVAPPKEKELVALKEFSITPKSRVWLGYIDVKESKKYQKTIKTKYTLNRKKEWLLILGHSHIVINATGKKTTFRTNGNLYLHYKDGEVQRISQEQFKKLNKGRKW